jgi:hypothetical protein
MTGSRPVRLYSATYIVLVSKLTQYLQGLVNLPFTYSAPSLIPRPEHIWGAEYSVNPEVWSPVITLRVVQLIMGTSPAPLSDYDVGGHTSTLPSFPYKAPPDLDETPRSPHSSLPQPLSELPILLHRLLPPLQANPTCRTNIQEISSPSRDEQQTGGTRFLSSPCRVNVHCGEA